MNSFGLPSPIFYPLLMVRTSVVVIVIGIDRSLPLLLSLMGGGASIRSFRDVKSSLHKLCREVITLKKAKDSDRVFGSHFRRDRTEFTFYWLMNLNKEIETTQLYFLRVWDRNFLQNFIFMDATVDSALMIDCAEPYPMVLTRESLRLCCSSEDPRKLRPVRRRESRSSVWEPNDSNDGKKSRMRTTVKFRKKKKRYPRYPW